MDPISLITAALTSGAAATLAGHAAAALEPVTKEAVKDAYEALKSAIKKRLGNEEALGDALNMVEKKPESSSRTETLKEELTAAEADKDDQVLQLARDLIRILEGQSGGPRSNPDISIGVTGNKNIFSGTGDVTVHGTQGR